MIDFAHNQDAPVLRWSFLLSPFSLSHSLSLSFRFLFAAELLLRDFAT